MFPSTLSTFMRPNPTDRLSSPSHSALHNAVSSALGQVEAVIGVDGASSVVGTMMYDLRSPASSGGGHVQTANKGGTGQITYSKGDILVAQSSSVLTKLSVGTDGYLLNANSGQATGVQWVAPTASALGIATPTVKVATVSSIWSKPTGLSYVVVEVSGGGGGGSGRTTAGEAGGGGGGGGYARKIILASVLGSTETLVVGAGAGGGAGSGAAGSIGGTTGFGVPSILYATGGSGGTGTNGIGGGGTGGAGFLGDVNFNGGTGGDGFQPATNQTMGGAGGDSQLGHGAPTNFSGTGAVGVSGTVYGGGGSGAASGSSNNDFTGGNGAGGIVIITEYFA